MREEVDRTPYEELPHTALAAALDRDTDEFRALVAHANGALIGVALYGMIAGTQGTARLILIAVAAAWRFRGIGQALAQAALEDLRRCGARVAFVELPDDPAVAAGRSLLEQAGFTEASRVPDYFRPGVALVFLRRDVRG